MEKMRMESINLNEQNVEKIGELFPNVITEAKDENGKLKKSINFVLLKQLLSADVVDGDEAYEFTWVGKRASIIEAGKPVRKTLRPTIEESKLWDKTENLFIEGNNLDVMKLLQESYLSSIKMIYIDPPYNTGNDFVYNDTFEIESDEYNEQIGLFDENKNRLFQNNANSGRYHSAWCSMIYPRLVTARNLLCDDGVIFISIDDNEIENLKKICDEVFGSANFIAQLTIIVKPEGRRYGSFAKTHDYILVYCKNLTSVNLNEIEVEGNEYQYSDEVGGFNLKGLRNRNVQAFNSLNRPNLRYPFYVDTEHPDKNGLFIVSTQQKNGYIKVEASIVDGLESVWRWGKEKTTNQSHDLVGYKGNDGTIRIFQKERKLTQTAKTVWSDKSIISNKGTKELQLLLGKGIFDFPKPLALLELITKIGTDENSIVLDFFAGSATTAHAVMKLNSEDGGNRKFIMVQLPEDCQLDSEARKAGYNNICEIGKDRIRRAGEKVKDEAGLFAKDLDIGFRVLKLDSTNMKEVYYSADEYSQGMLSELESNIKEDRTDIDLLFSCLLEWGLPLSLPHVSEEIDGVLIHTINEGDLIACFTENISEVVVKEIAKRQPLRAVFRDSSFANSPEKINVEEIFKLMAPNTSVKVL